MTVTPFGCRLSPFLSSPSSLQPLSKTVFALKHPFPHSSTITRSLASVLNQKQETLMAAAAVEPATLDGSIFLSASNDEECYDETQKRFPDKRNTEPLVIRRPVMDSARDEVPEPSGRVTVGGKRIVQVVSSSSSSQDLCVDESDAYSVKSSVLEPERIFTNLDRPLRINLELALYRAKVLARSHQFADAEKLMRQCINIWPEDGRPYVALGRILIKQSKTGEARTVYEQGCQATQGENSYIWQCWAVLEKNSGNIRRSRELFDAATVADERHVAAWHGWAVLEIEQGNIKKARHLLGKGLKICGPSEYIYQTLALLEVKGNRIDQARYLFQQATLCNPKSCASWLAWAQMEEQQENHGVARKLLERAVQASPKNRFAWHVWGLFEVKQGDIDKGRKLLKIGHALNRRDPVILQSLALLEYKRSSANLARVLFKRAAELDPKHQPVWTAWGWMEWKEGNLITARKLYQKALSIDSTTENAAWCLQAWGVLEQRVGNLTAARRLFRSSLNINSQSYVTWMTWASLEEEQGNSLRADEIRNLYFQQRTEIVDDASWVMGFLDLIDPALDSIKKLLNLKDNSSALASQDVSGGMLKRENGSNSEETAGCSFPASPSTINDGGEAWEDFDLDSFVRDKLFLDESQLEVSLEPSQSKEIRRSPTRSIWRATNSHYSTPSSR